MKGVPLTEALYQYLCEFGGAEDSFLQQLRQQSIELGMPQIHISPEQLACIQFLLTVIGAKRVVEIGSLAGYSTLGMLRVLPEDGVLYAFEKNPDYAAYIRKKAEEMGAAARLELVVGDAHQQLRAFRFAQPVDFAFLDADKPGYRDYWELLDPVVRVGGIIAADNALMGGKILDEQSTDPDVYAMREFNRFVQQHSRYRSCIVPVGDGMIVAVKLR